MLGGVPGEPYETFNDVMRNTGEDIGDLVVFAHWLKLPKKRYQN